MWKRNIAVYMIAECREIEKLFDTKNIDEEIGSKFISESYIPNEANTNIDAEGEIEDVVSKKLTEEIQEELENNETEIVEEVQTADNTADENVKIVSDEIIKEMQVIEKENFELEQTRVVQTINEENFVKNVAKNEDELSMQVQEECEDNLKEAEKLLSNIKDLITKQQNHAKIAGNIGAVYSALINAFEMRKVAETLLE